MYRHNVGQFTVVFFVIHDFQADEYRGAIGDVGKWQFSCLDDGGFFGADVLLDKVTVAEICPQLLPFLAESYVIERRCKCYNWV